MLLDTDVASEVMKESRHPAVNRWFECYSPERNLFLSVVTLGEIQYGIHRMPEGARRKRLQQRFLEEMGDLYEQRILPVTETIAARWAIFRAARENAGRPLSVTDGLIGATAYEYEFLLVTRNVKDFEGLGLTIVNPFQFVG